MRTSSTILPDFFIGNSFHLHSLVTNSKNNINDAFSNYDNTCPNFRACAKNNDYWIDRPMIFHVASGFYHDGDDDLNHDLYHDLYHGRDDCYDDYLCGNHGHDDGYDCGHVYDHLPYGNDHLCFYSYSYSCAQ